jgi:hypothetical protein
MYIEGLTRDKAGNPIICRRVWLRTDRFRLLIETDDTTKHARRVLDDSFCITPSIR